MKGNLVLQAVTFNKVWVKLLLFHNSDSYKGLFLNIFSLHLIDMLNTYLQIGIIQFWE